MSIPDELKEFLWDNHYTDLCEKPGRGICGIGPLIFTKGLYVDLDRVGYECRYCYHTLLEARQALADWDGKGHPPGNWIVRKPEDLRREDA